MAVPLGPFLSISDYMSLGSICRGICPSRMQYPSIADLWMRNATEKSCEVTDLAKWILDLLCLTIVKIYLDFLAGQVAFKLL